MLETGENLMNKNVPLKGLIAGQIVSLENLPGKTPEYGFSHTMVTDVTKNHVYFARPVIVRIHKENVSEWMAQHGNKVRLATVIGDIFFFSHVETWLLNIDDSSTYTVWS